MIGSGKHPSEIPPTTRQDNVKEVIHGVQITDPYRWLEDQESPETRKWIEAQNEYTDAVIGSLPGRDKLTERITDLMRIDSVGMPAVRNGRYFFLKREAEQELAVICMRKGLKGKDTVLIDPHSMSPDQTTNVHIRDVSEDGRLLGYGIRRGGQDESEIRLLDVDSRKELADHLPSARYFGFSMLPDKSGFYYSRHGEEGSRVYYHGMGTDGADDTELFGGGYGPDKGIDVDLSEDGRTLLITVFHGAAAEKTELYYQNVARKSPISPLVNDLDARFIGEVADGHVYLQTNWDAPKGRILRVDLGRPARENWQEVVPESEAIIENFSLVGGRLFVNYLHNASSLVKMFRADGKPLEDIELPAIGTVEGVGGRWSGTEAFLPFSSFHIPTVNYRLDLKKGTRGIWSRLRVPVESDAFEIKQVWFRSKDGTRVPMFLVHGKNLRLDGSNPTLLTGYGGFNLSRTPGFSARTTAWIEKGGVFALPNLRGGGEFGEDWHRAGMLEKKQNVFDDFLAAAEWLIANKYTTPSKLAISGGSNGGLLVGAAITQRPELFRATVCTYPLLDMIRYHKFLIASFWVPEYGSSEDAGQFKILYAYSPYHRVKKGTSYPAVLFITGDGDTRVAPLHGRKMAALLQSATGSNRPVLLRYHIKAGHSGGQPLSEQIENLTDELSFLSWQLGMTPSSTSADSQKEYKS
jgi:prolyl oligopeptidase